MREEFEKLKEEQLLKAHEYEAANSYEMAYLSHWIVLEKGLKIVDTVRRRTILYRDICNWKEYLERKTIKQPGNIKSFSLKESEKIPDVKSVAEFLDDGLPVVTEIMNTQRKNGSTKWRDRRNSIAHNATSFGSTEKYFEYREKIRKGIAELGQSIEAYKN